MSMDDKAWMECLEHVTLLDVLMYGYEGCAEAMAYQDGGFHRRLPCPTHDVARTKFHSFVFEATKLYGAPFLKTADTARWPRLRIFMSGHFIRIVVPTLMFPWHDVPSEIWDSDRTEEMARETP